MVLRRYDPPARRDRDRRSKAVSTTWIGSVRLAAWTRRRAGGRRLPLREHAPELAGVPVRELGQRLENTAFVAGELVLRVAGDGGVIREARLLELLAPRLSIPVPASRFADAGRGVLAYPLDGRATAARPRARPGRRGAAGRFLRELHGVDTASVAELVPADRRPTRACGWTVRRPARPRPIACVTACRLRAAATCSRMRTSATEHILGAWGRITGVIDWSDAAVTDPALDFARLYRDFGAASSPHALDASGASRTRPSSGSGSSPAAPRWRIACGRRARPRGRAQRRVAVPPALTRPGCDRGRRVAVSRARRRTSSRRPWRSSGCRRRPPAPPRSPGPPAARPCPRT